MCNHIHTKQIWPVSAIRNCQLQVSTIVREAIKNSPKVGTLSRTFSTFRFFVEELMIWKVEQVVPNVNIVLNDEQIKEHRKCNGNEKVKIG